jgi:hypothetical protein
MKNRRYPGYSEPDDKVDAILDALYAVETGQLGRSKTGLFLAELRRLGYDVTPMHEEKMDNRYSHWFWNSSFINFVALQVLRLSNYLWKKQYGEQYQNDYWHKT